MDINLLGPLTASETGVSIVPSAGKPRQILALLALNAGRMVTVASMMEELWGLDLPRSAPTTLQTYIMQLRRKLALALSDSPRAAKDVLVTRNSGYLLLAEPGEVDARRFDLMVSRGYAAFDADPRQASDLLGEALALWRGPALVDLPQGRLLEVETMRLHESRIAALERRIDADLRLQYHHEVLSELAGLTAQHPLHENFHAQFMLALHRCGRSGQALEAFRKLRSSLVDELGLEPSGRVQRLQQAILSADPELDPVHERGLHHLSQAGRSPAPAVGLGLPR
ncbi:AfsR/SARP family transcriptional regulator [Streptacidiphilus sp. PB12-B1b]|uniref:AfsR/SARP family transcriptional regulator n=1 Tax=Streptacidiphilus sp. PB12-B1b TaxID=2705012 RepID=UPI0015FBE0DC|nr:AfsR/SARP family transcriptional regulator [Streptacidiphilus sp. PB12-B1b]QMU78131.1 AfsR/SARP family transcriptional regulator [Streptacidiphilus sp. PB12-B1b]